MTPTAPHSPRPRRPVVATDERRYEPAAPRTPDELLRDAWAIRHLLDDLAPDEHDVRIRLIVARDRLRLEAAQQWRDHGWRAITDEF